MIISYRGDLLFNFSPEYLEQHPTIAQKYSELLQHKMLGYWGPSEKTIRAYASSKRKELFGDLKQDLPNPRDFIDNSWDSVERDRIANYLDTGKRIASWMGTSECRICGRSNGSTDLTDGKYIWPSGFSHYLREHKVKPPLEFLQHIASKGY